MREAGWHEKTRGEDTRQMLEGEVDNSREDWEEGVDPRIGVQAGCIVWAEASLPFPPQRHAGYIEWVSAGGEGAAYTSIRR